MAISANASCVRYFFSFVPTLLIFFILSFCLFFFFVIKQFGQPVLVCEICSLQGRRERECIFVFVCLFVFYQVLCCPKLWMSTSELPPTNVCSVHHLSYFQTGTEGRRCYCWEDLGGPGKTTGHQDSQVLGEAVG